jgi:pimeloyl-ACP methyl ester carboxylesterase
MHGVAVLRYDRRADAEGHDIPLRTQVRDAHTAMEVLRQHVGQSPIGLWGFSQGGWVAPLAAATHPAEVAFLITVSASGVSPAAQMRYGTADAATAQPIFSN